MELTFTTRRLVAGGAIALALAIAPLTGAPEYVGLTGPTGLGGATPAYAAGDVCDICGAAFDPVKCEQIGGWPYDSVEEAPPPAVAGGTAAPAPKPVPVPAPQRTAPAQAPSQSSSSQGSATTSETASQPEKAEKAKTDEDKETSATETGQEKNTQTKKSTAVSTKKAESEEEHQLDGGDLNLAGPATIGGIILAGGGLLGWWWLRRRSALANEQNDLDISVD